MDLNGNFMIISFDTRLDLNNFLLTEKSVVHEAIVNAIEYAFQNNEDSALAIEAVILDEDNSHFVMAPKEVWTECLQKSLSYFETIEEYEMCEIIFTLKKEIENA